MTAIKPVVWVVTAHRSFKFGPYVTSVASKAHNVITCFSRESPSEPLGRDMYKIGPANLLAVSRVQLVVNRESKSF